VWLTAVWWALGGLNIAPATAETRVALVIGNADYRHARVLPNPRNDAEAIAALLRQIGFAPGDITLKLDLDYKALRDEVRAFAAKAAGADVAIVYYAGHGIEVAGENYLVPVDAKLARDRDLEYEAVTLASVLDAVSEAHKLKLVILDACRDNPLSHKINLRAGITRQVTRGLERIEPKGDVLVAYAAKAGTVALDGTGKHSPYAEALLKHMATPGIDVFRLFGRVSEAVLDATKRQQEPWLYGRPSGEAIALVPVAPKTTPALGLPPPPPPPSASPHADGLSATEAARICREVAGIASLSVLGAMADQHKGTAAGACVAARMEELTKVAADKAKAEAEKKTAPETKLAATAPPKGPDPLPLTPQKALDPAPGSAPVTECDRLAAAPGYGPAGVPGVPQDLLDASRAVAACREAVQRHPTEVRLQSWLGRSLKKAENYGEARLWHEKAAEKGEMTSMTNLGWLYQNGKGVAQDFVKARLWFEKAAERGEPTSMHNLGILYRDGKGVPQDDARARAWFEKAAEKGVSQAMTNLGTFYYAGRGGPQDYAKALSWYEMAAEKGELGSIVNLGALYRDGKGVPQDYSKARAWFEKAVERGSPNAMAEIGWLHQNGQGVPQSYAVARDWYEKAAAKGSALAMTRLGVLFHNGQGVERSYVIARGWYEKAVERSEPAAMRNLALLYAGGRGVAISPQTAARYLLAAARLGSVLTRRDLDGEMKAWPQDTRMAVQDLLAASGDYRGSIHGHWDQASRDAAKAYYLRRS
jgi:TPR repeat protein